MEKKSGRKFEEKTLFKALAFVKNDLKISESEIASVLNMPAGTIKWWFSEKRVILNKKTVKPAVAHLIGIHRNLCSMFSTKKNRFAWLKTPHPDMANKLPPWDVMCSHGGLSVVHSYTDAQIEKGA